LFSCTEDDITLVDAVMAGYDYRECVCCVGMVVNPSDGGGKIFQWYQKNENFGIDDSKNYPLNVRIKYHHISESCVSSDGEIEIDALEIQ
jgi:hypothetical protein